MRRLPPAACVLVALLAAACGGSGDDGRDTAAGARPATTAPPAATAPCGLKPMTFVNERWEGSGVAPPGGSGVLWEQKFTFSNPNSVDVRLTSLVVHLRLAGPGSYFFMFARTTFRPAPDEVVPPGVGQQRVAEVWLAPGNTPATEDLFGTTSARVEGADCPVAVERLSTAAVPAHVLSLPSCDPKDAGTPC